MTGGDPGAAGRARVERAAQGLPEHVTDPAVLDRVARIITTAQGPLRAPSSRQHPHGDPGEMAVRGAAPVTTTRAAPGAAAGPTTAHPADVGEVVGRADNRSRGGRPTAPRS